MSTSLLPHLPLSLDLTQHTRWTANQENAIHTYPFADQFEGVDSERGHEREQEHQEQDNHHAVVRVYLQFLWLPESIMPLSLFVPAIASASTTLPPLSSSPSSPHPLHTLLDPLIMPPRAASSKYHVDLPQILADGGGAGEIEENMMWFALSFEKSEGLGQDASGGEEESEPWKDEKWRKTWLERMERREVQIQILLHFLKLSLPGPKPPDAADAPSSSVARMRQRSYLPGKQRQQKPVKAPLSTRDALEVYMDKMSTWQLMQGLERDRSLNPKNMNGNEALTSKADDERDWIQIFVEDVVEKQFRSYLPELCDLFHEKVFPTSPISDINDDDADIIMSIRSQPSTRSNSPAEGDPNSTLSRSISTSSSSLSRSRSLSVSLQQERESQRDATNQQKRKKRALNREVSMSRVFRAKSKAPTPALDSAGGPPTGLGAKVNFSKDKRPSYPVGKGKGKTKAVDESEITLVEATPALNRTKSFSVGPSIPRVELAPGIEGAEQENADMDMDVWESELPESKDIIMGADGTNDGDAIFVVDTPTKVKRRPGLTKSAAGG